MTGLSVIPFPSGDLHLRPETREDDGFRFALFCQSRGPEWDSFPEGPMLGRIMQMQFHAQTTDYRMHYPAADFSVISRDGRAVGRLVAEMVDQRGQIIDIALLPQWRGRGIGSAVVGALQARCLQLFLSVGTGNAAAQRLYGRLGFAVTGQSASHLSMEWLAQRPPGGA